MTHVEWPYPRIDLAIAAWANRTRFAGDQAWKTGQERLKALVESSAYLDVGYVD